jgi:predicted AlkP superfamily phosphohydrolase/phosphomutase
LEEGEYTYRFPDFRDLQSLPFFDELAQKKIRSVIINLPSTYPARQVNGVLVSGFVAPDLNHAVYPLKYIPMLKENGYMIDVEASKGKDKKLEFISDLHYSLKVRTQVADYFWGKERWDLFMLTITGTDRLHHFLFDAFADKNHQFHNEFFRYYQAIDGTIGNFYDRIKGRDEYEIVMLSDHGFVELEKEIYVNQILRRNAFFNTETENVDSLGVIAPDAKAFALDPSRIFIHLKEKYPKGKVEKRDYHKIRSDIKQLFEDYEIGSRKVIKKVYFKEDIYSKKCLDSAPDLIMLSHPGFDLKAGLKKNIEYGTTHFTGMHLYDNAFFFSSSPDVVPDNLSIFGVKSILYKLLNVNISG